MRLITPHLRLASVLDLRAQSLRKVGIEGLLLDLDNTLKDHGAEAFPEEVIAWAQGLREDEFRLCILSNGRPARVGVLARQLDIPFVARACKPLPFGCHAALKKLGLPRERAALVGDQIFADVPAGRLAGLYTILVHPTSPDEPWFTRLKRPLERTVLKRFPLEPVELHPSLATTPTERVSQ
jgi:HAD superfamily phosphatase (TIGR01668 family)